MIDKNGNSVHAIYSTFYIGCSITISMYLVIVVLLESLILQFMEVFHILNHMMFATKDNDNDLWGDYNSIIYITGACIIVKIDWLI